MAVKIQKNHLQNVSSVAAPTSKAGELAGRNVTNTSGTAKIQFEKVVLTKGAEANDKLIGAIAITQDNNHKGWLHVLIYIGQVVNALFTGKNRKNVNLCHSEVIIGINESEGKKGDLLLAHAIFGGIKTTSESHKKDEIITGVCVYRPVDRKISIFCQKYAKQTAVNFKDAGLSPKNPDFKSRMKKEVVEFSMAKMISSVFHRQMVKPKAQVQKNIAYAVADLIKGDKLRDEKGRLASYFCTAYVLTLAQATAFISTLDDLDIKVMQFVNREQIAERVLKRITAKKEGDILAATYWDNEFMQLDANHTMSYAAGDVLDRASGV